MVNVGKYAIHGAYGYSSPIGCLHGSNSSKKTAPDAAHDAPPPITFPSSISNEAEEKLGDFSWIMQIDKDKGFENIFETTRKPMVDKLINA